MTWRKNATLIEFTGNYTYHADIISRSGDYRFDYDATTKPCIFNEHATAASRYFHTLVLGHLKWVIYFSSTHITLIIVPILLFFPQCMYIKSCQHSLLRNIPLHSIFILNPMPSLVKEHSTQFTDQTSRSFPFMSCSETVYIQYDNSHSLNVKRGERPMKRAPRSTKASNRVSTKF